MLVATRSLSGRTLRIVALVVILASLLAGRQAAAFHDPHVLVDAEGSLSEPRTDGTTIVWSREGSADETGIWAARSDDLVPRRILSTGSNPDIDGNTLVWQRRGVGSNADLIGMHLDTNEEFIVADSPASEANVTISGRWVTWLSYQDGVYSLLARDIDAMSDPIVLATTSTRFHNIKGGAVSGDRVAWMQYGYSADTDESEAQLFVADLSQTPPQPRRVAEEDDVCGFGLAGNLMVYMTGSKLNAINLDTGDQRTLTPAVGCAVSTDGRYVVWDNQGATTSNGPGIMSHDLQSGTTVTVTTGAASGSPQIENGLVVWVRWRGGAHGWFSGFQIFAVAAGDMLPITTEAPPTEPDPQRLYFWVTGHSLRHGFKNYWEANGGLPIFGYPLTREFQEFNPDTEDVFTVQYLERQRFEWHPENIGTPYEVLLGRLGVERLQDQGIDWTALPTADPASPHYFPETGHAIAPEFYDYWSSHGLEFGDEGTSHRETLALFGYPISEPMIETNAAGDTVLTQYFERAVFELHPDLSAEYHVLLRLLGAELLDVRGW